jgi:cyclase
MLKTRIIPTLLWKDFGLVKGIGFDSWRRVGTVLPAIKVYNTREVDELILADISATNDDREPDYESIEEFCAECFVPITVGGGIRNIKHITKLLRTGADKVSINTAAYENPILIQEAANKFGSQCVVASIDCRTQAGGGFLCFSDSGRRSTGKTPREWAIQLEALGAGEILLTSIERDGTMQGYDLKLIKEVAEAVRIPVIASGGARNYDDMAIAVLEGKASAVAAASIFHFTQHTPLGVKNRFRMCGIPTR